MGDVGAPGTVAEAVGVTDAPAVLQALPVPAAVDTAFTAYTLKK
jgi:hypothetical protein